MSTHTEHTENFETYFCTLVCYRWLPLFEITNFYDQVYNWFDHLKIKGCYILGHHNPVQEKRNLVEDYVDYQHSSARFCATGVHGVYEVTHDKEIVAEDEEG